MRQLDREAYDALLWATKGGTPSPVPVIIDIDEKSLRDFGQWPWPRHYLARMLEALHDDKAAAVALDILLSEPDRTSPAHLRETLRRDFGVTATFGNLPEEALDNDAVFARALAQSPAVLGAYLRFDAPPERETDNQTTVAPKPPGIVHQGIVSEDAPLYAITQGTGLSLPLSLFVAAAPIGTINAAPDTDGVLRLVPLVVQTPEGIFPSLAIRALMRAEGKNTLILRHNEYGLAEVRVGKARIPVTPEGLFPVPFRGPENIYTTYSAADVISGKTPAGAFTDRIVLVGSSAAGLLDIRVTPFDAHYPGVAVHAAVLDAVYSGRFIRMPPWTPALQFLGIIIASFACAALFGACRPLVCVPAGIITACAALFGALILFRQGMFVSPNYVVLAVAAGAFCMLSLRFWQEELQKRRVTAVFERYVAPEVVSGILAQKKDVLAGEKREVTILFTDIRGFTPLSERLEPEQVVALLNRYFTPMTACIRANKGTLDKFIGDALMAFWNAPLDVPRHAALGVETALRLQENLVELNTEIERDFALRLRMGAGLHMGEAFVGNMGSAELLDYTIIGDSVNLASRLEGLTSRYGVPVVISKAVKEACGDEFAFLFLDSLTVKGKHLPVDVFEPLRHADMEQRQLEYAAFSSAREKYLHGSAADAMALFSKLASLHPGRQIYALYAERCKQLQYGYPPDWTGAWTLTS